jgi:EAL domain-containing protein (putative c-di-GMP-specific phosphodiesterase class I)
MKTGNNFPERPRKDKKTLNPFSFPSIEKDLYKALDRNEFVLFYQPQINIRRGDIIGNEALIRWNHPKRGIVSPDEFIPLAEKNRLIVPIGEWVLRTACAQNKRWHEQGYDHLVISLNLSPLEFAQDNIVEVVENVLRATGLSAQFLTLEITESMTMNQRRHDCQNHYYDVAQPEFERRGRRGGDERTVHLYAAAFMQ